MKNILEILKDNSIELTEEQSTAIEKSVKENYKALADYDNQKKKLELAEQKVKDTQTAFDEFKKGFEGVDVKELKGKVDTLNSTIETQKADYEKRIKTMELDGILKEVSSTMGCVDYDLAKTQIDYDKLLESKNQKEDVQAMFTSLKETKPILFEAKQEPTGKSGVIGGNGNDGGEHHAQFKSFI